MDAGIIWSLKSHYRRLLVQKRIAAFDRKENFRMSLIDALVFLRSAWNDVTQDTIRNCFNKAFDLETSEIEHHDPAWSNAEEIWEQLCLEGLDLEGVTFSDYVNIDRDLPVSAVPTDKDIID